MCLILFVYPQKQEEGGRTVESLLILKLAMVILTWPYCKHMEYNTQFKFKKCVSCFCGIFRNNFDVIHIWPK